MSQNLDSILLDLAPTGAMRAAINYGNPVLAQRSSAGELSGVSVDLARELARRLGKSVKLIPFDAAGKVFEAARVGAWDIAFLAIDPVRAEHLSFTAAYALIEGTYVVRSAAPFHNTADLDQDGLSIAVGTGAAYDLYLTQALKKATLVRAATSAGAMDLFVARELDAAAGIRQPLAAFAHAHQGLRVVDGHFTVVQQAVATQLGRPNGLNYLRSFLADLKASGLLASILAQNNQLDVAIAWN